MMSTSENMQIVESLYRAFGQGDMATILGLLAEDIDWYFNGRPEDVPFAGQRHGHQAMIEFFTTIAQTSAVYEFAPREVMAFDDKVLVLGHERVCALATDRIFETDWAHLYTIQGGKIVRLREYYDTAAMAAAYRHG
jgi:ketosteroid isomerase-like protein